METDPRQDDGSQPVEIAEPVLTGQIEVPTAPIKDLGKKGCPWPSHTGVWCVHGAETTSLPDGPAPEGLCDICLRPWPEHYPDGYVIDPETEDEAARPELEPVHPTPPWEK